MKTGLMGLGAIGTPIAHKQFMHYRDEFVLLASEEIKQLLLLQKTRINGDLVNPCVLSGSDAPLLEGPLDLILICIKNYDLKSSIRDIKPFVGPKTILLPLQNGIYSYELFCKSFPNNAVLRGYVQGPNTEPVPGGFVYQNPGELHIGSDRYIDQAKLVVEHLRAATTPAFYEDNIEKMVWKKWMLNVAGNSVTALTGADYSLFKLHMDLQKICRRAMEEFLEIAHAEGVGLSEKDIDDIIEYYVTYLGSKKTSMLVDVMHERKTENDYLAGMALEVAKRHGLDLPIISTLYYLMEVKEEVYMERKGIRTVKKLFTEGVEYSDALRIQMNDVAKKMEDKEYARLISSGDMPDQLLWIMQYAAENTAFYAALKGAKRITDFPVMNKAETIPNLV